MSREITKTETGGWITTDHLDDGTSAIRLWSADFKYLGRWCDDCRRWHLAESQEQS